MQSNDTGLILFKEFYFWYLLNLLIDKLGFNLYNIEAEIVYPFKKYLIELFSQLENFKEELFVIYLENAYHSNNYSFDFVCELCDRIEKQDHKPDIYIYSLKISHKESVYLLDRYEFIKIVIRTDIEYFFYEIFNQNKLLDQVANIVYKDESNKIITTEKQKLIYELWDYLLGGHYSGYLNKFKPSKDYIINLLDDDEDDTSDLVTYLRPKSKKIADFRYRPDTGAMISTGRWCRYNCTYCYRWVKYSTVRQVPLDVIEKDLEYLKEMYYEDIYVYDDCFLTTNVDRLEDVLSLMWKYDFYYGLSIRYEMCNPKVFDMLKNINLYRVQIGLQSISLEANKITGRGLNIERFKWIVQKFRERGVVVSIDIILWLPWETLKDFLKTVTFALSLDPGSIHINTLFLNPGTQLYDKQEEYWIVTNSESKTLFSVPALVSSDSFSERDIEIARKFVEKLANKKHNTRIILR